MRSLLGQKRQVRSSFYTNLILSIHSFFQQLWSTYSVLENVLGGGNSSDGDRQNAQLHRAHILVRDRDDKDIKCITTGGNKGCEEK